MTIGSASPRILYIDSYDSFTFNLVALTRKALPNALVYIVKNDQFTIDQLLPYLPYFDAVVVGPGPGNPGNPADIGIVKNIWHISKELMLPIFGVCLGLQSLCLENGARVERLPTAKHGRVYSVHHSGTGLFEGVGSTIAVRYHSLHVKLEAGGPIEQLAWAEDEDDYKVVMAVAHTKRPFWGVQYHPESICTDIGGLRVFENFWSLARKWSTKVGRRVLPWTSSAAEFFGASWPPARPLNLSTSQETSRSFVTTTKVVTEWDTPTICQMFNAADEEYPFVLLESLAQPGKFSIIGCLEKEALRITHWVGDSYISLIRGSVERRVELHGSEIWDWLSAYMKTRRAAGGDPNVPFWGGLVGIMSYELGLLGLDVPMAWRNNAARGHPDVNMVFVERSIVIDHHTKTAHVQSLLQDDIEWIENTAIRLSNPSPAHSFMTEPVAVPLSVSLPSKQEYINRIHRAQECLASGDSYELCLTAQTRVVVPSGSSWKRYQTLRKTNPAPHSGYIRLSPTTLLSSSPERFMSFSRPPTSLCQFRPIKGTVRKAPGITRADAEKALAGSVKEVAENLMIVDLIRHDLHGVVGENVSVRQFCQVEEYETVYQLVSVIEGSLPSSHAGSELDDTVGWEALRRTLPPGSMTGAPKKRSVEILQTLEHEERNVYSGVFGYWCVGGGGDWSVVIRSCFKLATPETSQDTEEWRLGAGGAITALSDPEAEWEEMTTKLGSVLKSFGVST